MHLLEFGCRHYLVENWYYENIWFSGLNLIDNIWLYDNQIQFTKY